MPEHVEYWGIPHQWGSPNILVYSVMFLAGAILIIRFFLKARIWWKVGRPDPCWNKIGKRIINLIQYKLPKPVFMDQLIC